MDSAAKESILSERLSERLGGLILKDEQKLAVEALMAAAALGKLTGLVFEKPGKKVFGT